MSYSELMMLVNSDINKPLNELIGSPYSETYSGNTVLDHLRLNRKYLEQILTDINPNYNVVTASMYLNSTNTTIVRQSDVVLLGALFNLTVSHPSFESQMNIAIESEKGSLTKSWSGNSTLYLLPDYTIGEAEGRVETWFSLKDLHVSGNCIGSASAVRGYVTVTVAKVK